MVIVKGTLYLYCI